MTARGDTVLSVHGLSIGYGSQIIQSDISFSIAAGSIFAIMGGSGCGKSTLLKALIGLIRPTAGTMLVGSEDYWACDESRRAEIGRGFGVLFQSGALWSSMSTADNVALPLTLLTGLDAASIAELVRIKLSLVGLSGAGAVMPAELSGGMRKRAGLARAMALDPSILFFDEPSAGLDPFSSRRLDDLILELRDGLGRTVVMVSHELPSLFAICDDGIFLDAESKTSIAHGAPSKLRDSCDNPIVQAFMRRSPTVASPSRRGGRA